MWKHGEIFWNEYTTHDVEAAQKFFSNTIGWTFEAVPMSQGGTYHMIKQGDSMVGGMYQMEGPEFEGVPDHWMTYIAVDDVDARIKQAEENGATLMKPILDIPDVGRFGIVQDPNGAYAAWITPSEE